MRAPSIVEAPNLGWGSTRTITELAAAGVVLAGFAVNELRSRNPLFPFSIFRIKGLAAADLTQLLALAGFYSMFFFVTLYMQNVLGYSNLLDRPDPTDQLTALTSGYRHALLASGVFVLAAAVIGLRSANTRGERPDRLGTGPGSE